jgi:non-ribosomal peptide synthetase component E (peptide arylation enzyme)
VGITNFATLGRNFMKVATTFFYSLLDGSVSPVQALPSDHQLKMMVFGDRTAEFASVAQALRNQGLKPQTRRKDNMYTARMNINKLSSEIGKDTHATAQKLAVLTRCT